MRRDRSLTQTPPLQTPIKLRDTDRSDRHLLCKHQNNCDDTDHSHRHLLCKQQYNCEITHTDTSSANTNKTAATQITHTDTSSAKTDTTATTQITLSGASSANTNITAATRVSSTRFRDHSKRTRHCGELIALTRTVADGCERLRTLADTDTTFCEHSLTPTPPSETGTLATHSGKSQITKEPKPNPGLYSTKEHVILFWLLVCNLPTKLLPFL